MNDASRLNQLQQLLVEFPGESSDLWPTDREMEWMAQVRAALLPEKLDIDIDLDVAIKMAQYKTYRTSSYQTIKQKILHEISRIRYTLGEVKTGAVYEHGKVLDFRRDIRRQILDATKSVFVVDPYADEEILYLLADAPEHVASLRLLHSHERHLNQDAVRRATQQIGQRLTVRKADRKALHDRLLIIDNQRVYVVGQSFKDAASTSPTYVDQVAPEMAKLKVEIYEELWASLSG